MLGTLPGSELKSWVALGIHVGQSYERLEAGETVRD